MCRFLDHLEKDRGVSARSRNVRLAAIHSFFHYVALQEPALGTLAQSGVDRSVISLWLGHERMDTTQIYLHASLELKEKALAKTEPFYGRPPRYRPPDQLMAFLQSL